MKPTVDKQKVKQGDAVNLTVRIAGKGNIGEIEVLKIDINNATIYSDDVVNSAQS
jgi:hypothetical protein